MNGGERAVASFKEGLLCSQSVFSAFSEKLGLDRETACRISTPFGGGMARMGETCGAVTGAFMAIGLKYGNVSDWRTEDKEKENTYRKVGEFVSQFNARNGTVRCKELLGCDLSTAEGRKMANDRESFTTLCPKFVRDAAEILEKIL